MAEVVKIDNSYGREDFTSEAKNKVTEIIRNYALVVYARRHELMTIKHWRGELVTLLTDFQDMETKPKKGNRKMVMRAIRQMWIDKMELDTHPQAIVNKFIAKFNDEGIIISKEESLEIAQAFINDIDRIIHEMSFGNYDSAYALSNAI